jgi:thiol-disulfide isomerase/thioredoxin
MKNTFIFLLVILGSMDGFSANHLIRNQFEDARPADLMTPIRDSIGPDLLVKGGLAYNFSLPDPNGKMIHLSDFKGKVVLVDFWFTGCGGCARIYHDVLSKVEEEFRNDQKVVFVSVSVDKSKENWISGIRQTGFYDENAQYIASQQGKYTSDKAVNLYTNGLGIDHTIIKQYKVTTYPSLVLIDSHGYIISCNMKVLRLKGNNQFLAFINKAVNSLE